MIKAIETSYKGYRFRSRLEARWAVYFDSLGMDYSYEPEGFDLGDGVFYLPDFWVPALNSFVEVKPGKTAVKSKRKVYLAGKMTSWRLNLARLYDCTNPFGLDKQCYHADFTHQMTSYDDYEGYGSAGNAIAYKSLNAIAQAEAVFAFISSLDCFGTLTEIGFAKALAIPIYTAVGYSCIEYNSSGGHGYFRDPDDFHDSASWAGHAHFVVDDTQEGYEAKQTIEEKGEWGECWFPIVLSNKSQAVNCTSDAEKFFQSCLPPIDLCQDEQKAKLLSEKTGKRVIVLRDIPEEPTSATCFQNGVAWGVLLPGDASNFSAARAARFEFGR